ncbi:mammaglobin-A [Elephas maximus indicus]|uniref:mammaglobin-A n=1 Tax=Elephas maximus indicus TaxID=99487 RepID=UPI0021162D77|nr:mammaglobin-A [Elephas maximus indicus]
MRLVMVLMLVALPLYCYAGSGCQLLEDGIEMLINPEVSEAELREALEEFTLGDDASKEAIDEFKQCFLKQTKENADKIRMMMRIIYSSTRCELY